MRFFSLNNHPGQPCIILKLKDLTIMLDCHLEMSSVLNYLPTTTVNSKKWESLKQWTSMDVKQQLGNETNLYEVAGRLFIDSVPEVNVPESGLVDFSSIDVILLTNYFNVLALPYITEFSGFSGQILATEPTLQIGRLFMEELVSYNANASKKTKSTGWKNKDILKFLPYPLYEQHDAISWSTLYTAQDVSNCISKIRAVGFSEKIDILGLMQVTAVSSGFAIGSANWLLQTNYHKICYLSSSSMFATHAQPMDQNSLNNADVCIMNSLTESCTVNPDAMLRELCSHLAVTLKNGGNVLIPCFASGVIFDLFEYLCSFMDGSGLSFTPIYFISPVAHSSLEYANIYAEWLNQNKQAKMYLPEPPFAHHELVKTGRVKHFPNLHDGLSNTFKSPCVVFAGHPSLRYGDAVHFMELWSQNAGNTVIFIDSEFPYLEALTPYQPISMKVAYCPIDPRLNFQQANKLLREIKPKRVLVPKNYTAPPTILPQRTDLTITQEFPLQPYNHLDVIDIPLRKSHVKVELSNEVLNICDVLQEKGTSQGVDVKSQIAQTLCPKQIEPGLAVASVKGKVITRDNKHTLKMNENTKNRSSPNTRLFGDVDVDLFVMALKEQGIRRAEVEATDNGHIVHFPDIDAMIQLEAGNTHIINHTDDELRVKIKAAILSCLVQV